MPIKPQCCLSLLCGLALLTSATAEANVSNAVAVTLAHHASMHKPLTVSADREAVEERVFPTRAIDQVVHEFQPFAGKLISKDVIDLLHRQNFAVDAMRKFDHMFSVYAINELTRISDDNFDLLVIWFGIKSPKEQEVVLDLLVARLKANPFSRHNLLSFFEAGKAKAVANDAFRVIAATVETRWLMSLSTNEMYDALGLSYILDDEEFVRHVGHLIWEKCRILGEQEFTTFMLTKMRERSEDEVMWASLLYKLDKDKSVEMPLSGVFDDLLRSKAEAVGNYRPIDAAEDLTSPELVTMYNDKTKSSKETGAVVVEELLKWSKDELMWAKLIYILQNDESVPTIPPSVLDHLLQPYETSVFGEHQCTPSQAIKYLTSPELSQHDIRFYTDTDFNAKLLTELLEKSPDQLMWSKVLCILKTNKKVSVPLSSVLTTFINSWTEIPYHVAANAEQTLFSLSKEILKNPKFIYLYLFAHFSSDNPDVFLLEKLRERSADDLVWAQALNAVGDDQSVPTPLSGILDALFHSWIGEPYNAAALAENEPALINAYKFLLKCSVIIQNRLRPPSPDEAMALVKELLDRSNDELMWAKFLYKLQQDQVFSVAASSAFDALLQLNDAAQTAHYFPPSSMVEYLKSQFFFDLHKHLQSADYADALLLSHLFPIPSPNQVLWAKVLYIMQNDESESKMLYANLLKSLLLYWTYDVAGVATSPDLYIESESYLESQCFANMIAYARYTSDKPDVYLLEKLLERSADDFMWARLLSKVRMEHLELQKKGHQVETDAFSGVLNALLHSWVGKPYDATAAPRKKRTLIAAYDYLTSENVASWYTRNKKSGNAYADKEILDQMLRKSNDGVMWAKLLSKLQNDSKMEISLFDVFNTLIQSWDV